MEDKGKFVRYELAVAPAKELQALNEALGKQGCVLQAAVILHPKGIAFITTDAHEQALLDNPTILEQYIAFLEKSASDYRTMLQTKKRPAHDSKIGSLDNMGQLVDTKYLN